MCDSNDADVVIPHDMPFLFLAGDLESVLEDYRRVRYEYQVELKKHTMEAITTSFLLE